jgi:hypothetical protein
MSVKKDNCGACGKKTKVIESLLIEVGELSLLIKQYQHVLQEAESELGIILAIAPDVLKLQPANKKALKEIQNNKN